MTRHQIAIAAFSGGMFTVIGIYGLLIENWIGLIFLVTGMILLIYAMGR